MELNKYYSYYILYLDIYLLIYSKITLLKAKLYKLYKYVIL